MRKILLTAFLLAMATTKILIMDTQDLRELIKTKKRSLRAKRGHKNWFWGSEPTKDPSPVQQPENENNSAPTSDSDEDQQKPQADDGNDSNNVNDQQNEGENSPSNDEGGEHDSNPHDEDDEDTDNLYFVPSERGEPIGHQKIHNLEEPLWPALCQTKNHGLQWGKHDGKNAFYTIAVFSVKCKQPIEKVDRSDLEVVEFDPSKPVSPCKELVATSKKGTEAYPVLVKSVHGEIPGKVLVKELREKGGDVKGYFGYDGNAYQGTPIAWLC